jgi:hypothetical protein
MTREERRRLWMKIVEEVDPSFMFLGQPCWTWLASLNDYGYGQFRACGTVSVAHRFVWELCVGPIPDGMVLDHLRVNGVGCKSGRRCVNPAHLQPVTIAENTARGDRYAAA